MSKKAKLPVSEYLKHFNEKVSKSLVDYADNVALKESRYLVIEGKGKNRMAYCTHCNQYTWFGTAKQNTQHHCPVCLSECLVKHKNIPRKNLIDRAYIVYFEPSECDANTIVARGIEVKRDYSGSYRDVKTMFAEEARYIFSPGEATMMMYNWYSTGFYVTSSVFSLYSRKEKYMKCYCSIESIERAIIGTVFQYSLWVKFCRQDNIIKYFALLANYPIVEQLVKSVGTTMIEEKIMGHHTFNSVNWNAKTIFKALRLNRGDLKEIKESKISLDFHGLKMIQMGKKTGSKLSIANLMGMGKLFDYNMNVLQFILKYASLDKAYKFIEKQKQRSKFNSAHAILGTWKDYIDDCIQLQYAMRDERVLYPKDIDAAHQNTLRQIKIKVDESLNIKIKGRVKKLRKQYAFSNGGFFIRPAESSIELMDEGNALNHCVGRYANDYANGGTDILFVRKTAEPEKPFYTMEVHKNQITQVRSKGNKTPEQMMHTELQTFIKTFQDEKLEMKTKIKVAV